MNGCILLDDLCNYTTNHSSIIGGITRRYLMVCGVLAATIVHPSHAVTYPDVEYVHRERGSIDASCYQHSVVERVLLHAVPVVYDATYSVYPQYTVQE